MRKSLFDHSCNILEQICSHFIHYTAYTERSEQIPQDLFFPTLFGLFTASSLTMVFVLGGHIGEYDPDHPVADDEHDRSERQGSVAPPLQPGLKTHSGEKSNHPSNMDWLGFCSFYLLCEYRCTTWAPVLHSSLLC